jgi:polyhydroxybutyrate depolymerase
MRNPTSALLGGIASSLVISACVLSSVLSFTGCSQNSSPQTASATGGKGAGGASVAGGATGSGGASLGTGGTATGTGGAVTGTGGTTSVTGGNTTGAGGTGGGGASSTGVDAAVTVIDGGSGGSGGTGGSSDRRDGGTMDGRGAGGVTGTGGSGNTGGSTADGGGGGGPGGLSAGCGKTTAKPNRKTQQTITIGGATRYYLLNVPSSADASTPLPLVLALHGYDMNNVALVDLYDFTAESGNKAITALPQGEGPEPGTTSHWGDSVLKSTWSGNAANYDFMQQLVADIESKYCVDTARVFITGFSMGGMFTNSMACDHNDWFRGYAPVEGGGPGSCAKADAKPAIIIHQGTADTIATPAKGGEPTRDFWTKQNGCSATTTSIYTGCQSYGTCAEPVIYCVGNWTHTVDRIARANIWKFFDSLK